MAIELNQILTPEKKSLLVDEINQNKNGKLSFLSKTVTNLFASRCFELEKAK